MRRGRRGPGSRSRDSAVGYALSLEDKLTHDGLAGRALARPGDVLLIACGALAREVRAVVAANGLDALVLECLPAKLHNTPEEIAPAVRSKIADGRARGFARIAVLYADCGTGGALDRVCEAEGVVRIPGPHCYAFFDGNEDFAARAEEELGAFFLTDFLVKQFDMLVWRILGLDRAPQLHETYFGQYDRLVYLAQTDDDALDALAREQAARLGLAYHRRFTGYGELGSFLKAVAAR